MITRLQVRNFKSLRDIDLPLGPLNVLVGRNMAGKSNILDVFSFLYQVFFPEPNTQGVWYALAQRGGSGEVVWKGGDTKLISFALEGVDEYDPETKYKYVLQLIAGVGNFVTVQDESLKLLRAGKESELLRREGGTPTLANADGKNMGGLSQSGISALQYAPPDWDGYKFYEWVRQWRFYHLVPPLMKAASQMGLGQALRPNGDNLSAWLMWLQTNSPEAFSRINEALCDLLPEVLQVKTTPTQEGNVHLAIVEKGLNRSTTVWQLSDGLVALTALLSLIYVPAELSGTLLCVEEPENYLHPRLLETLIALLRQVRHETLDPKEPPSQIIFTTQSPHLVDQMRLDEIIWVEKKDGETKTFRPSDQEHLRKLVESKDLGLGDLVFTGALSEEK